MDAESGLTMRQIYHAPDFEHNVLPEKRGIIRRLGHDSSGCGANQPNAEPTSSAYIARKPNTRLPAFWLPSVVISVLEIRLNRDKEYANY